MPGFNTYSRKDDISLKLRTQHMKIARDQTKRLEEDNRKMEERLRELKAVMNREKELREKQSAGFWGRGQPNTGSLTNYASEVLKNQTVALTAEGKIRKVKVLREETEVPVYSPDKPKSGGPPGVAKHIAARKLATGSAPKDKQKGPKCGQCEDKTATVSCFQCSEIYCPGCFAAFHLKGALKQHRSTPLSAAGPRVCMSPSASTDSQGTRGSQASELIPALENNSINGSDTTGVSSSKPGTHGTLPTLLQGDYDESQSAESFQAALMAWRTGTQPNASPSKEKQIASPAETMDESIGTSEESKIPEIKFKSSLSYAEKLMVKKHLRMKLAEAAPEGHSLSDQNLATRVSEFSGEASSSMRATSQLHSSGSFREGQPSGRASVVISPTTKNIEKIENSRDTVTGSPDLKNGIMASLDDDPVDFLSLFEAVKLSKSPDMDARCDNNWSDVSITDLFPQQPSASEVSGQRSKVTCTFKEVSPMESWQTEHMQPRSKSQDCHGYHQSHMGSDSKPRNPAKKPLDLNLNRCPSISELPPGDIESPIKSESNQRSPAAADHQFKEDRHELVSPSNSVNLVGDSTKPLKEPRSDMPRPRSKMSKSSRPSSRASKIRSEGYLTKTPSESLKIVAQMAQCSQFPYSSQPQLGNFFLLGVDAERPAETESRLMTPSKERNRTPKPERQEKETVKISNRLYQMSPRSWHPANSLNPESLLNEVTAGQQQNGAVTLSYSYGRQKSGHDIEWRPSSSQNMMDRSNGDPVAATPSPSSPQNTLAQRSTVGQGDTDCENTGNPDKILRPTSQNKLQKAGHHRFNKITTPGRVEDICSDLKISLIPPDKKQDHQLSSLSSPFSSTKSNQSANFTNIDQNAIKSVKNCTERLELLQDGENVNQSRNSARSHRVPVSLKDRSLLKSEKLTPRTRQNQASVRTAASYDQIKTVNDETVDSKPVHVSNRSQNNINREVKNILTQSNRSVVNASQRPNSSTNLPTQSEGKKVHDSSRTPRPSSSSVGSMEPMRRSQVNLHSRTDSVVTEMMRSRAQTHEDTWVNEDLDFSHDYDDGDNLTPEALHLTMVPKVYSDDFVKWETEVRPFSGISTCSRKDNSDFKSTKGDHRKISETSSCRSASAASHKSGRTSQAIVVDGDDLSCFDSIVTTGEQGLLDKQTLDQLEWELASSTGRLTVDGKVTPISVHASCDLTSHTSSVMTSMKIIAEKEYDIAAKLLADEKQAENNVESLELRMDIKPEEVDEVRALR